MGLALAYPDNRVVEAAREGDGQAFADLVGPLLESSLGLARAITGSQSDASDAVQEALIRAWNGLGGLRRPGSFAAWFRTLVVRSALIAAERRRRIRQVPLTPALADTRDVFEAQMRRRQLEAAFVRLSPQDRAIVALHYFYGADEREAAAVLRIPRGTVKSRLHRATSRLRAAYDAEERP